MTDPWGTADSTGTGSEAWPSKTTSTSKGVINNIHSVDFNVEELAQRATGPLVKLGDPIVGRPSYPIVF